MSFHSPVFERLTDLALLGRQSAFQQFDLFGPALSPPPGQLLLAMPDAAMTADHQYRAALPAVSVYSVPGHTLGSAGLLQQGGSVFWRDDVLPAYFRDAFKSGAATPPDWLHGMRSPDVKTLRFDEPLAVATHPNTIYGHFLLEMLPRLYLLALLRDMGHPFRLALSTLTPDWMDSLVALYFAPHEVVRYDSARQVVLAPAFITPAMMNADYYLHPVMNLALADFVARVRMRAPKADPRAGPLVYLSRRRYQDGSRSMVSNGEAVEVILAELGFAIVHPETLSMCEQVELYGSATCLMAEYGSGAHNALFAPLGSTVIVINRLNSLQDRIAALRGQRLGIVEPIGGFRVRSDTSFEHEELLVINTDALRGFVSGILESLPRVSVVNPTNARRLADPGKADPGIKGQSMFEQAQVIVAEAEEIAGRGSATDVIQQLRKLCLSDFSELLGSLPQTHLPNISARLPRMASVEVQQSWTGGSGQSMLQATLDFVKIINYHYTAVCQRSLAHAKIMDYGCGYGRLMRPFYYFTNPDRLFGIDPWDRSLEICAQDGVLGQLRQSEFLPNSLPVDDEKFDLIYAFSVFTHTSLQATTSALNVLRKYISSSGILVLTTRPIEYWSMLGHAEREGFDPANLIDSHKNTGFSYFASDWNLPADGISIFGDTSFTPEWCMRTFPSWNIRAYDRGLDPMQMILILTPR